MAKRNPRIFIGINEIGNHSLNLARGFHELGYEVTNAVFQPNTPVLESGVRHNRYIKRGANKYAHFLHRLVEFCRVAPFHDIFIFIFAESFFPSSLLTAKSRIAQWLAYRDLPLLKAMGKKIVIVTNGCDVRHYSATEKQAKEDGFKYHVCFDCDHRQKCSLPLNKKKVETVERYADYILSNPLVGVLFKRAYFGVSLQINLSMIGYAFTATPAIHLSSTRRRIGREKGRNT